MIDEGQGRSPNSEVVPPNTSKFLCIGLFITPLVPIYPWSGLYYTYVGSGHPTPLNEV